MLYGFKCLANGECYIFGEYQGFTDANGFHPEQVLMSRMYMPGVGVNELSSPQAPIRVWPNPGSGSINVAYEGHGTAMARFFDLQGRMVLQRALGSGTTSLDVSSLSQGVYTILAVRADGTRSATKWIKQ